MSYMNSINSILSDMANANDGSDHGSEYSLYELPIADSMMHALGSYFSGIRTSNSPPQPPESWNIRTMPLTDPETQLRAVVKRWFYEMPFSPRADEVTVEQSVNDFLNRLRLMVDFPSACEVSVNPPMWYECHWQDFAFDGVTGGRFLLHFGYSD